MDNRATLRAEAEGDRVGRSENDESNRYRKKSGQPWKSHPAD